MPIHEQIRGSRVVGTAEYTVVRNLGADMRIGRRRVLSGFGVASALALAGCTTGVEQVEELAAEAAGLAGHPLEGSSTVAVVDRGGGGAHDLDAIAAEALAYWEANAPEYVGFSVDFELVATDGDGTPDVEIRFVGDREDLRGCQDYHTEDVLGCAPILPEGSRPSLPVVAEVVAGERPYGEIRLTTKHELGHLLGLDHDDEPAYVMSNDVRDRLPEYDARMAVLEAIERTWRHRSEATRDFNAGIERWNDEAFAEAVGFFEDAGEGYEAGLGAIDEAVAETAAFEGMARPETVDSEALADGFERTREVLGLAAQAAGLMATAARAAADGDRETARDRHAEATEALEAKRLADQPSPTEMAIALGLAREPDHPGADGRTDAD